jgi:hypothetical protein
MALKLLIHIANAGRKHKEFICECQGVRAVAECLARSKVDMTQDYSRHLLQVLGMGNPKYLMPVYKTLLSLLTSPSSLVAQQMSGQALRALLPIIPIIHVSIVEATLALLKSPQLSLQHEGYELLRQLLPRENLQEAIMSSLIEVLQMIIEDNDDDAHDSNPGTNQSKQGKLKMGFEKGDNPLESNVHLYIEQSYAIRLLGYVRLCENEIFLFY